MTYYCATHCLPLTRTPQSPVGAPDILTCPECTAATLDRLAAEPGSITINLRDTERAGETVLEQSETLDVRLAQTARLADGSETVRLVGESRKNSRTAIAQRLKHWEKFKKSPRG